MSLYRKIGRIILSAFSIGAVLITLLHNNDLYLSPIVFWFGYFMPWTLVFFAPLLIVTIVSRHYRLSILLLLPLFYVIVCNASLFLNDSIKKDDEHHIKVLSYNVWSKNKDVYSVANVIQGEKPQIVFLQEVTPEQFTSLYRLFTDKHDSIIIHNTYSPEEKLAVFSAFPITPIDFRGSGRMRVQKIIADLPNGTVTLFNVHLIRAHRYIYNYMKIENSRFNHINNLLQKEVLRTLTPVILAGDLNITPHTPIYKLLSSSLDNSHQQAGWGFGFTYPANYRHPFLKIPIPPLVRIDHIFHSRHFSTISSEPLQHSGGSDHLPVAASLVVGGT